MKAVLALSGKQITTLEQAKRRLFIHTRMKKKCSVIYIRDKRSQKVIGEIRTSNIITDMLPDLWKRTRLETALSKQEFCNFFKGRAFGSALHVCEYYPYKKPFDCPLELKYGHFTYIKG